MIKIILVSSAIGAMLTGCAGGKEAALMLRESTPIVQTHTPKAVDAFIGCLNPKLIAIRSPVSLVRDGPATVLRITSFQNTVLLVSATPDGQGGSDVQLRARFDHAWGVKGAITAINECR